MKTESTLVSLQSATRGCLAVATLGVLVAACSGEVGTSGADANVEVGEAMNSDLGSSPGTGSSAQQHSASSDEGDHASATQGEPTPALTQPASPDDDATDMAVAVAEGDSDDAADSAASEEQPMFDPQGEVLNDEDAGSDDTNEDGSASAEDETALTPIDESPTPDDDAEDDAADGDGDTEGSMTPMGDEGVADLAACEVVSDWDPEWVQFEDEVLLLTNEERAKGADCGSGGSFQPAGPLAADSVLRCAARLHSLDMYERDFFDLSGAGNTGPSICANQPGRTGIFGSQAEGRCTLPEGRSRIASVLDGKQHPRYSLAAP